MSSLMLSCREPWKGYFYSDLGEHSWVIEDLDQQEEEMQAQLPRQLWLVQTIKTNGLGLSSLAWPGLLMSETCIICNWVNTVLECSDDGLLCNCLLEALVQPDPYL